MPQNHAGRESIILVSWSEPRIVTCLEALISQKKKSRTRGDGLHYWFFTHSQLCSNIVVLRDKTIMMVLTSNYTTCITLTFNVNESRNNPILTLTPAISSTSCSYKKKIVKQIQSTKSSVLIVLINLMRLKFSIIIRLLIWKNNK